MTVSSGSKEKRRLKLTSVLWFGLVALAAFVFLLPTRGPWIGRDRVDSIRGRNAADLSSALQLFHEDHHGRFPTALAELVPEYISVSNLGCLLPLETELSLSLPSSVEDLRQYVESEGAYEYLGAEGARKGIIAYERDRLNSTENLSMSPSAIHPGGGVYAILSDFSAVHFAQTEFRERFAQVLPPEDSGGRKRSLETRDGEE